MLFLARREPSEVFDTIEEPLDAVARAIQCGAEAGLPATVDHRRDVRCCASGFDAAAQPISIIGFVGEHDRIRAQPSEQMFGHRTVAGLARCQHQFERQTARVGQRMDLGR